MYYPRNFKRDVVTLTLGLFVLIFIVTVIRNKSLQDVQLTRLQIDNVSNRFPGGISQADPLNGISLQNLLAERMNEARKILAENGMVLPAPGGVAKRILIVTTWRSGSTFTGELLSAIPGVVYNSEPFRYLAYNNIPINNATLAANYVHELRELHQCNYGPILKRFRGKQMLKNVGLNSNAAFKLCREIKTDEYCQNSEHISYACRYFPIQVDKLVRMPLSYVLPLLRQREQNFHVVLLVRDPRGTVASRQKLMWCMNHCTDRERFCGLLRDNYETALRAAKEFPDTFTVLRYEDLALDPENVAAKLFQRVGIPLTSSVRTYIEEHTNRDESRVTATTRQKGSRVALWKTTLPWKDIEETQNVCGDTLNKYGYLPIPSFNFLNKTETLVPHWELTTSQIPSLNQ